jgi:hypothetical protein
VSRRCASSNLQLFFLHPAPFRYIIQLTSCIAENVRGHMASCYLRSINNRTNNNKKMNISELSDDVVGHIFTFLSLLDVYNTSQSNKYFSQFIEATSPIWKSILSRYIIDDDEQEKVLLLSQYNYSYKQVVKESLLKFDLKSLRPELIGPKALTALNNNRTIKCHPHHKWISVKTTKQINDNSLYAWEVVLDVFKLNSLYDNIYKVFIGIENNNFPFYNQNTFVDTIGSYTNSTGYALNVGDCNTMAFHNKDVIRCIVETRHSMGHSITFACFSLYKIDQMNSSQVEICVFDEIDLLRNGPYYPAVSLINERQLTIRPCHDSTRIQ